MVEAAQEREPWNPRFDKSVARRHPSGRHICPSEARMAYNYPHCPPFHLCTDNIPVYIASVSDNLAGCRDSSPFLNQLTETFAAPLVLAS